MRRHGKVGRPGEVQHSDTRRCSPEEGRPGRRNGSTARRHEGNVDRLVELRRLEAAETTENAARARLAGENGPKMIAGNAGKLARQRNGNGVREDCPRPIQVGRSGHRALQRLAVKASGAKPHRKVTRKLDCLHKLHPRGRQRQ